MFVQLADKFIYLQFYYTSNVIRAVVSCDWKFQWYLTTMGRKNVFAHAPLRRLLYMWITLLPLSSTLNRDTWLYAVRYTFLLGVN